MLFAKSNKIFLLITTLLLVVMIFVFSTNRSAVDYNTEVKPILNKNCITCHGGVKSKAGFSVLFRSEALAKTESGKYGIIPGDPEHSEMIRRIKLNDPEERMPYKHPPLSEKEIDILTRWIKQGAHWGDHWAYVPVKQVEIPREGGSFLGLVTDKNADWCKNNIDHFILEKLDHEKLEPSVEADKVTLARRVSLDLTGLPPSSQLLQHYLQSNDEAAYEQMVDSLLASPHYGERWTSMWLDLARYADTKGYERDGDRSIWRYRDWLIHAFNDDKPYNNFLVEQLAGDLMPNADDNKFIATAFHRNTMTNDEGGTDNEEFRTAAVIDRVNTTWQALLGTTFSCVQCHSHPYDPFSHDEYYKFMAFFNDTRDEDTYDEYPTLRHYAPEDSAKLKQMVDWLKNNNFNKQANEAYTFLKTWQPSINSLLSDEYVNAALNDTKWLALRKNGSARLKHVNLDNKNYLIFRYQGYADGGKWTIHLDNLNGPVLKTINLPKTKGWTLAYENFTEVQGTHDLYFSYENASLKKPEDNGVLFDWFYFTQPLPGGDKPGYASVEKTFRELASKNVPSTPVLMDNPSNMHRKTQVFERGNWLMKGKEVNADVPHSLNPMDPSMPRNRLGLAMWMTDKKNPLTARTMVNRLWEQMFGNGLVETLDDFGTQGAEPTHKELLDFLSWQFMNEYNWSIKKLLKEIVMSATYRQDSKLTGEAFEKDPYNKFYARGSRVRLSAEQVRDQALVISGLLSEKMYGPSVMPWQPEGIWMSPWNSEYWRTSEGEDQYRRAVYTFWKRTAPYPSMITFDGVGREVCTSRRIRTNTPLQALVTLNDSVYVEASRHFAFEVLNQTKHDLRAQIANAYQTAVLKPIAPQKLFALEKLYNTALEKFKKNPAKTKEMAGDDKHNNPEAAAFVVVTSALLNLDEVLTKN